MHPVEAAVLGAVQGITEFLPISSDGHLVLFQRLFGVGGPGTMAFDVVLHLPSLLVMVWVFRRDIAAALTTRRRLIPLVVVGSIPVGLVGLFLKDWIETRCWDNLFVAAAGWVATGVLLLWGARRAAARGLEEAGVRDALWVGAAQALAPLPGFSRSGLTTGAGMGTGLGAEAAVRFSFLLGMPAIAGATLLAVVKEGRQVMAFGTLPVMVGVVSSFAASALAAWGLLALARRGKLAWPAWYCIALGMVVAALELVHLGMA
ncbi:MAG: undecaprenyl-diphosphate phosphatase [Planctomycetota bacterium]